MIDPDTTIADDPAAVIETFLISANVKHFTLACGGLS
jgi:hypothetical protein